MPFFSVITPLYNKEDYIEATIKSVLNQTFDDFEMVIVDDGSTDNSLKILSQIKSSKINILVQENQGPSVARNKAIANAKGKYIAPLDADDIWREDHLAELKSLIDSFPNAGVFCNNYKVRLNKNLTRNAHFNFDFATSHLIIPDFFGIALPIFLNFVLKAHYKIRLNYYIYVEAIQTHYPKFPFGWKAHCNHY